jgi:hypothetical protein
VIGLKEIGRVTLMSTEEEWSLMFGRRGVKVVVRNRIAMMGARTNSVAFNHADSTILTAFSVAAIGVESGKSLAGISGKTLDKKFVANCAMVVRKGQGRHG